MLGSSSYSSEEDNNNNNNQDHHNHNHSSPSDLPRPGPPRSTYYPFHHLISSLAPSPPSISISISSISPSSSSSPFILPPPPPLPTHIQQHHHHPRQLLVSCAELISRGDFSSATRLLSLLSSDFASPTGDSTDRLLHYFSKALTIRLDRHFSTAWHLSYNPSSSSSSSTTSFFPLPPPVFLSPPPHHPLVVRYSSYLSLNQVTPFTRFIHLTANQAILEAVEGSKAVHIIDMDIMHGVQWPPLLQAVVERSTTLNRQPPTVTITGAGRDPDLLDRTGDRLVMFAQSLGCLEFRFHPLVILDSDQMVIDPAEAVINAIQLHRHAYSNEDDEAAVVAVHCGDYLHRLLKEYDTRCLRRFLHKVKTLVNPRVLTLGEREADHNHPLFLRRFMEALDHYGAIFDSLEATLPPQSQERVAVEEGWFGQEIKDVVGEEGERRKERHQKYESWEAMLRGAGYKSVALSPFSLSQAKLLLRLHYPSEGYQLQVHHSNCLLLGWKNRPLFSVSSWQ